MGAYDLLKDAAKAAQKADNIELYQYIMDAQQAVLDLQEKQQNLQSKIVDLEKQNEKLKAKSNYVYEQGHDWMIDPGNPDMRLCPVCLNRDGFENPLPPDRGDGCRYCSTCKKSSR